MNNFFNRSLITALLTLLLISSVNAASISAMISDSTLSINDTAQINLYLNLEPMEQASVFEGSFDLVGLGTVASANLLSGGPSWPSAFGNIVGDRALLSLLSNNDATPSRLIGSLNIQALNPGNFDVVFDSSSFAAFDIDVSPFLQDLPLTNFDGQVLASAHVVPLPPAILLMLSGISGLMLISRRRLLRR